MNLVEGKVIAEHYKLIRQLGQGSFGNVWLAHNLLVDIDVAIKFYGMLNQKGIEEFREEFKIAYALRHPNLLNINHFDIFESCPYLVMPYCEKGDVGQFIGKMDEEEIWRLILDVSNGLSFLHAFRPPIIHQDIKPENILITAEGRYVITDFGISHKLRTQLSSSENIKGTVAYMGPERLSSKPKVIIASDIWSFGATLYEIMEGKLLWEGMGGILQLKQAQAPDIEANYSNELIRLVKICLAADPSKRPRATIIYNYALAHSQHQPLPQLMLNDTAQIPVNTPKVHSWNGQTNRVNVTVSRHQTNNSIDGNKFHVEQKPTTVLYKPSYANTLRTRNHWKRWLPVAAICLCVVAVLSGYVLILLSIREESHSSRKYMYIERTPDITIKSPSAEPEPQINIQTRTFTNRQLTKKKLAKIDNNSDNTSQAVVVPFTDQLDMLSEEELFMLSEEELFKRCSTFQICNIYMRRFGDKGKYVNNVRTKMKELADKKKKSGTFSNNTDGNAGFIYEKKESGVWYNHYSR